MSIDSWLIARSKKGSRRNLYEWLQQALADAGLDAGSRVMNVGAGGEIDRHLSLAGLRPTSVDIDPDRKPDVVADLERLDVFDEGSFDAVLILEVLEHVRTPDAAVREIRRVLAPGGVVIGSTPFLLAIHDEPHDYYRFTLYGLLHLFREFEHVLLRERNGELESAGVLLLRRFVHIPRGQRLRTLLLSPLFFATAAACSLLDRLLPATRGTTGYFFVFRKPL